MTPALETKQLGCFAVAGLFIGGAILVAIVLALGTNLWDNRPLPKPVEVSVLTKEYQPAHEKRVWSGKHYVTRHIPECYAVFVRPLVENPRRPKEHFTSFCMNKEAWEVAERGTVLKIDR